MRTPLTDKTYLFSPGVGCAKLCWRNGRCAFGASSQPVARPSPSYRHQVMARGQRFDWMSRAHRSSISTTGWKKGPARLVAGMKRVRRCWIRRHQASFRPDQESSRNGAAESALGLGCNLCRSHGRALRASTGIGGGHRAGAGESRQQVRRLTFQKPLRKA